MLKYISLVLVVCFSLSANAEFVGLHCVKDAPSDLSYIDLEDRVYNGNYDYLISLNFAADSIRDVGFRFLEQEGFTPLNLIKAFTDEYGDYILSGLVLSNEGLHSGLGLAAIEVAPYENSCEGQVLEVRYGTYGGFFGSFMTKPETPTDKCICTFD